MRSFISKDDVSFEKYELGGGQVTDQTRIEWMAQKISPASSLAMADHRKMMKSFGKQDLTLDTGWFRYSDVLIMDCSELTSAAVHEPTQAPAQAPAQADKQFLAARASGGSQLTRTQLQTVHRFAAANGTLFRMLLWKTLRQQKEESRSGSTYRSWLLRRCTRQRKTKTLGSLMMAQQG